MEKMVKKLKQKLRSSSKKSEEKLFMENGSIFLKKLIADCNGISIPIRNFSSSQIKNATNNFDSSFLVNSFWYWDQEWYKGIIEDKPYLIRRFSSDLDGEIYNDIILSARMSNHNNFLKLIGCCFEFSSPVVVFKYEEHSLVNCDGRVMANGKESILPWSVRLKVVKEGAIGVTYLHTAFHRIIIHKHINPTIGFVDKNWKVKLTDFRFSVSLPEGKSRIEEERIMETIKYIDPLYIDTRSLSEYTDVYNFGGCLFVFLTGRQPHAFFREYNPAGDLCGMISYAKILYENGKLDELIDPKIAKYITSGQRLQVEACVVLALKCFECREEDRPKMIQVVKELKRIERMKETVDAI